MRSSLRTNLRAWLRFLLLTLALTWVLPGFGQTGSPVPAPDASAPAPRAEAPPAQPIPYRKDEDVGALALNVVTGLIVSIGLAVVVLFALRRHLQRTQQAPGKRLRVLETVRLTPKSSLFLIEVDRMTLLIGQHGDTLAVLAQPAVGDNTVRPADNA